MTERERKRQEAIPVAREWWANLRGKTHTDETLKAVLALHWPLRRST